MRSLATAGHYLARLRSVSRVQAMVFLGYRGARDVQIDAEVRIPDPARVILGSRVHLCRGAKLECLWIGGRAEPGQVSLGEHVFVGERVTIVSHERISVGASSMIAHNCSIMDFNHGTEPDAPMAGQRGRTAEVRIGKDCWLGAGVIVLPGVTIGDGTAVGAGSVVSRSLPESVIAAGVPARVLRPRAPI